MTKLNLIQKYNKLSSFVRTFIFISFFGIVGLILLNFYLKNVLFEKKQEEKLRIIELNQIQTMKKIIKNCPGNYYLGFFKIVDNHYETIDIINSEGSIRFKNPNLFIKKELSPKSQEKLKNIYSSMTFFDMKNIMKNINFEQKEIIEFINKSNNEIENLELIIIKSENAIFVHSLAKIGKNKDNIDLSSILHFLGRNLKNNLN
jgi:hypothetical protein